MNCFLTTAVLVGIAPCLVNFAWGHENQCQHKLLKSSEPLVLDCPTAVDDAPAGWFFIKAPGLVTVIVTAADDWNPRRDSPYYDRVAARQSDGREFVRLQLTNLTTNDEGLYLCSAADGQRMLAGIKIVVISVDGPGEGFFIREGRNASLPLRNCVGQVSVELWAPEQTHPASVSVNNEAVEKQDSLVGASYLHIQKAVSLNAGLYACYPINHYAPVARFHLVVWSMASEQLNASVELHGQDAFLNAWQNAYCESGVCHTDFVSPNLDHDYYIKKKQVGQWTLASAAPGTVIN